MKIEQLTNDQVAKFPFYINKWKQIGLCTLPAHRKMAEEGIRLAYATAKLKAPRIVWTTSPLVSGLVRHFLRDQKFMDNIGKNVWDSVGDSVGASVRDSVWASVRDSVGASGYGQHDANWIGFYDYFRTECLLKEETERLVGLTMITNAAGWYLPHEKICWVSERHNILNLNAKGQLHHEGGIALAYPDGWGIYALNGVRVDPWMAEMSIQDMEAKQVITITNVDQRREVIRRMGVDLLVHRLGAKVLDKHGDYQLLSANLGEGFEDCRMLKMLNPSLEGVWHVEGVHPDCDTVEKAINWRAGDIKKSWVPQALS